MVFLFVFSLCNLLFGTVLRVVTEDRVGDIQAWTGVLGLLAWTVWVLFREFGSNR